MIRNNPYLEPNARKPLIGQEGDCILTSSDAREQDLREFDSKEYLLIKFAKFPVAKESVDLSI